MAGGILGSNGDGMLGADGGGFTKNAIADFGLDLADLLDGLRFVEPPEEEIDIGSWSQLFVVVSSDTLATTWPLGGSTHLNARLLSLWGASTGSNDVTTALPAATTLLQSISTRLDSEKTLKLERNSLMEPTNAGEP